MEDGRVRLVSTDALRRMFELFSCVEAVVLNACYSEVQAEALREVVPWVVGMKKAIGDRAAREFAEGFYDGLGAGWDYQKAYALGRSAMANDAEVDVADFAPWGGGGLRGGAAEFSDCGFGSVWGFGSVFAVV
jgi:hypothetical protein